MCIFMPKCHWLPLRSLVHLRIAGVLPVLGGARRFNDGGVTDRAFPEHPAGIGKVTVDRLEDDLAETPALQEVSEIENGGLVRNAFGQPQPGKSAHRLDFVQGIFHCRITQVVEQLQTVNAKHRRQWIGRSTDMPL